AAAFAGAGDGPLGTGPAADARVAFVQQRMVGQAVALDVAPNVLPRPGGQGVDLDQAVPGSNLMQLQHLDATPGVALVPSKGRDPGGRAHGLQGPPQGL